MGRLTAHLHRPFGLTGIKICYFFKTPIIALKIKEIFDRTSVVFFRLQSLSQILQAPQVTNTLSTAKSARDIHGARAD